LKPQEGHCRVLGAARDFAGARALGNTEQQVDHPITPEQGAEPQLAAARAVQAVDATGAGDCFDGAFLAEYARHGDPFAAARFANAAAALSTLGYGAVAPLPRRADVESAMGARTA